MINLNLVAISTIEIDASLDKVWEVMTNPVYIKQYLFGTQVNSEWRVGSTISFSGNYNGQLYQDKGNILAIEPNKKIQYNYWNSFSGLEDKLENYSIVNYLFSKTVIGKVSFTWMQKGFLSIEKKEHTELGLIQILEQIKILSENN